MSRMIGHFFVWNSAQFVAWRLLETHKHVDSIFIFDGAYKIMKDKGFTKAPYSTDGTREIVNALRRRLKCKIRYMREKKFYPNKPAAYRKRSLKCWKRSEWMYLMADDEMLMGNVETAFRKIRNEKKAKVIYVPMKELTLGRQQYIDLGWKRRFFIWQPGLHWKSHHFTSAAGFLAKGDEVGG